MAEVKIVVPPTPHTHTFSKRRIEAGFPSVGVNPGRGISGGKERTSTPFGKGPLIYFVLVGEPITMVQTLEPLAGGGNPGADSRVSDWRGRYRPPHWLKE